MRHRSSSAVVQRADRLFDLLALLLLLMGSTAFLVGRFGLASLGSGTHDAPQGSSWVALAERHDAQTRWGLWIAVAGLLVALVSAGRHLVRARQPLGRD
jgi:hypothetical protein